MKFTEDIVSMSDLKINPDRVIKHTT